MSTHAVHILRLVLSGVNGVLFAFGIVMLLEMLVRRPNRWKEELRTLISRAERLEIQGDMDEESRKEAAAARKRIDELKAKLQRHYSDPRSLLNIGFALLVFIIALSALVMLVTQPFGVFG